MKALVWTCAVTGGLTLLMAPLLPFLIGPGCRVSNDRNAASTLKTVYAAQRDFREQDRDNDGLRRFWREDVAGLYNIWSSTGDGEIRLIEISAAGADLAPLWAMSEGVDAPKAGYWYKALRFEDEAEGEPDPDRFAVCAVPDSLAAGKVALAITHEGSVWERPILQARKPPAFFPLDPAAAGWRKRD